MSEVAEQPSPDEATEAQIERLSGGIYGTILVAGVLAASSEKSPDIADTALYVLSTVVVFWLAHAWADSLARRVTQTRSGLRGYRITLANQWPLVQSAFPPIAVMLVASALGASSEAAVSWAAWSCVLFLAGWGVVVARREKSSRLGIVSTSAACAALGLVMIGLKAVLN